MRALYPLFLCALLVAALSGCGTIMTFTCTSSDPDEPMRPGLYGGARLDAWELRNAEFWEAPFGGILHCLFLWDIPLSFAADTLTLPATALIALFRPRKGRDSTEK